MPQGIAVHLGAAPETIYQTGHLYRIYPSLSSWEDKDNHVVVASTSRAADHGNPETSVFLSDSIGTSHGSLDGGAEMLPRYRRIIGRADNELPTTSGPAGKSRFPTSAPCAFPTKPVRRLVLLGAP